LIGNPEPEAALQNIKAELDKVRELI